MASRSQSHASRHSGGGMFSPIWSAPERRTAPEPVRLPDLGARVLALRPLCVERVATLLANGLGVVFWGYGGVRGVGT